MTKEKILQRIGSQVYVEYENYITGELEQEWRRDPVRLCACGKREYG